MDIAESKQCIALLSKVEIRKKKVVLDAYKVCV